MVSPFLSFAHGEFKRSLLIGRFVGGGHGGFAAFLSFAHGEFKRSLLIGRFVGGGHGGFAAFLNMGVHTVMYLYYFLTGTCGSSNLLIIHSLRRF